jgi:hypothetical protein
MFPRFSPQNRISCEAGGRSADIDWRARSHRRFLPAGAQRAFDCAGFLGD